MGGARFGLVGERLGHSWSPQIHRALGTGDYELIEVAPAGLAELIRQGAWRGLNVTIPYKLDVVPLADEVSEAVGALGAANTLVRRDDGTILADNTDLFGFQWLLRRLCARAFEAAPEEVLAGEEALVLGSGGASRAVRCALERAGARVTVISRRGPETYGTLVERHADAALLVNTTPVGMYPHCPASPLAPGTLEDLRGLRAVVDVVYNPLRTKLLLDAERQGIPCEGGLAMLVAQAFRSSELFQGRRLPGDLLERTLAQLVRETRNVFFIGMPGCGKTGAGRRFARLVNRPFIDLDDAFAMEFDITPAQCITQMGEAAFRDRETQVLAANASRAGLVLATGGGVVLRRENLDLMRQNGIVVFLDRPLEELAVEGRPLSRSRGVAEIAAERMDLYRDWADLSIRCTGTAEGDARLVRELLGLVGKST